MDWLSLSMWLIALILGIVAFFRPGKLHIQGLKVAGENALVILPRFIMAIIISGFFSVIVPTDLVVHWLGKESGIRGILVGSLAGGFTPGGPMICFPIVAIFFQSGAGLAPLVAFLTSWSVFAVHRIVAYEVPMLGPKFVLVRVLSSIVLPPLAGILTIIMENSFALKL
jgi:uncharacterized protein